MFLSFDFDLDVIGFVFLIFDFNSDIFSFGDLKVDFIFFGFIVIF